jgi:two-component system, NarL family, nitrate/nitrite response regulator NarL
MFAKAGTLAEEGNLADDTQIEACAVDRSLTTCKTQHLPRVVITSKNRVLCESLVAVLNQCGFFVASCSHNDVPGEATCDVLLIDSVAYSLEVISEMIRNCKERKTVVFGFEGSEATVVKYAMAGVSGFVHANATLADLFSTIESAASGELKCSSKVAGLLLNQIHMLAARERSPATRDALTVREQEIASLIGRGLSNKQIARELNVQDNTVKNHVHSILGKMGVQRRGEVIVRFSRLENSKAVEELVPTGTHA